MTDASEAKRRLRRAKDSERRLAKWLIANDGPDPKMAPGNGIVSETGRVGHVTAMQFDALSLNYAAENKHARVPAQLWDYWVKIVTKSAEWDKHPLIRIEPTNLTPKYLNSKPVPPLHIITEARHAELLAYEKQALKRKK